jgi:hypothetical protein
LHLHLSRALNRTIFVIFLSSDSIAKISFSIAKDIIIIIKAKTAFTESCIQVNFAVISIICGYVAIKAKRPQNKSQKRNSLHSILEFHRSPSQRQSIMIAIIGIIIL